MSNFRFFTDQLGQEIQIPYPPKKIISIVPSQTELLFDLGLGEEIIGVTKFCVHPEEKIKSMTKVGGTKNLNIEKIKSLQPDLIIGNKEENEEQQVKKLRNDFPIWMSDIKTLKDAYVMITEAGEMVNRSQPAISMVERIKSEFSEWVQLRSTTNFQTSNFKLNCAYLIWNDPLMTVGNDTFIHHMLGIAGFENVFVDKNRYPEITMEELKARKPVYIFLSSEPFPFRQRHADELQQEIPSSKTILVDGEMFSWYGSRLLRVPTYFEELHRRL
jgi:ABC-type Fe3+-hydroxamate transport system substrate-binding protein